MAKRAKPVSRNPVAKARVTGRQKTKVHGGKRAYDKALESIAAMAELFDEDEEITLTVEMTNENYEGY